MTMSKAVIDTMVKLECDEDVRKYKVVFETGYIVSTKSPNTLMVASKAAHLTAFVDDISAIGERTIQLETNGVYSGSFYLGETEPYIVVSRYSDPLNRFIDMKDVE